MLDLPLRRDSLLRPQRSGRLPGAHKQGARNLVDDTIEQLQQRLQYRFANADLLIEATTHASAHGGGGPSNERLEFLGDSVIGLVIADHLFERSREMSEGEMTVLKSAVVSRRTLARVGRSLGLADFLQVDEGLKQRKRYPGSIIANAYEAVVGAVFVDGGLKAATDFILRTLEPEMQRARAGRHSPSYKSILQQRTQAEGKGIPRYSVVRFEGPDHQRRYLTVVHVCGEERGGGWGPTKKAAEQNAARDALDKCYPGWPEEERAPSKD